MNSPVFGDMQTGASDHFFGSHLKMAFWGRMVGFWSIGSACAMVFDVFWAVECIARVSEGLG